MDDNPYAAGTEPNNRSSSPTVRSLVCFTIAGGVAAFGSYTLLASEAIEKLFPNTDGAPTATYGQQAGLIITPICTLIGVAIGFALHFAWHRQLLFSIFMLVTVAAVGSLFVLDIWQDQFTRIGPDRSELFLYYPPMALCGFAILLALVLLAFGAARAVGTMVRK